MKILFLAKHNSGDNDDEGAVAHALRQLGHEVVCVHEKRRHRTHNLAEIDADLCLFFKHEVISEIAMLSRKMPCVFWYFDMVRSVENDTTLAPRSFTRIRWMQDVLPFVQAGFCTDGDWVADDRSGKLHWLMQGADERVAGFGRPLEPNPYEATPILFMGMVNHGLRRRSHIEHLRERWGDRFLAMGDGGPRYRKHGRELADVLASVKVVVAPDGPSTDRYWSNRVWLTLSLGGFLLHPYCKRLEEFYDVGRELCCYHNRDDLNAAIDFYLSNDVARGNYILAGHRATMSRHTYRHRVEEMLRVVKERT